MRARLHVLAAVLAIVAAHESAAARDLTASTTGEAAVAQPMVVLAIEGRGAGSGRRGDLADLVGDLPALAVLDTGASGHVLSAGTAARFDVRAEPGSRYVEVGMSGEHAMAVSRPVTIAVESVEPTDADDARGRRPAPAGYRLAAQRLLLNEGPADLAAALLAPGSMVDVLGMPLIRERVVEIAPVSDALPPLAVRLHPNAAGLAVDAWIALALVDFNRRHPRNRGPLPSLATNPIVPRIAATVGAAAATGDWLLDTGAAASMISTATARRLGLVAVDGTPVRRPDFTLPLSGVGGAARSLPGFRLDRLAVDTTDGRTLVFPAPAVLVHDVSTVRADGTAVTLDGILGMNLLLPSGSGMTMLGAATQLPGPFARVVIDAPRARLGVALR